MTLAEVLEGSSASDVKDIVASLPDTGTISAAAMITAGLPHTLLCLVSLCTDHPAHRSACPLSHPPYTLRPPLPTVHAHLSYPLSCCIDYGQTESKVTLSIS